MTVFPKIANIANMTKRRSSTALRTRRISAQLPAVSAFENSRGERTTPTPVASAEAQNAFARVLDGVLKGRPVVITKYDSPTAVLLSVDDFNALAAAGEARLDTLSRDFDELLERMQAPRSRAWMKATFDASPERLGKAAVRAARKRV